MMGCDSNVETAAVIEAAGVKKTFRMGEVDVPVLRGVDMRIHAGELTVILGASGSGKSTLLNIIGGIDRPSEGSILFHGSDLSGMDDSELTEYRRRSIGFVFQFYNLVPTLTARENVAVSTEIADNPMDPLEALKLVGLDDHVDHFPSQLSGGQQQRVAIARAIAKNPALMLCDEPTGALDAQTGQLVLKTLSEMNKRLGATIVIITHASPIASMARRVIKIANGVAAETIINEKPLNPDEIEW